MHRLLIDQNFDERVLAGVLRQLPETEAITLRALGAIDAGDDLVLSLAMEHDCVLLTHDARTMPAFMTARVVHDQPIPRVIISPKRLGIGRAVEEIVILLLAGAADDWVRNPFRLPI